MRFALNLYQWALVIGCWSFALGAFAQSPASDAPMPPKLRFLFLDETAGHYSIKIGAAHRQISANPYEISAPYTPADLKPFDIYKTLPDPKSGSPVPTKIARFTPPSNTHSGIVVVTPIPPSEPGEPPVYNVEFIDGNPSGFPPGSLRIINRGQSTMAARYGTSEAITPVGESSVIKPTTDNRHRTFFKVAIQIQQSGGWELLQDSLTIIRPDERMIGILVYSPGGMKHMLTHAEIVEFGPPKSGHFWLTCIDRP